uniref:G-protein coupled receptors family 3 profile domain-containing protein n=1 Tax=Halocynthia roretzi TaxID=7729 RepID=Q5NTL4_HALRO|nr:hypothetical protein 2 [Halocynthia roretzi]
MIVSVCLSLSACTVLFCLFGPRCYTILFHPDENTPQSVMSSPTSQTHRGNGNPKKSTNNNSTPMSIRKETRNMQQIFRQQSISTNGIDNKARSKCSLSSTFKISGKMYSKIKIASKLMIQYHTRKFEESRSCCHDQVHYQVKYQMIDGDLGSKIIIARKLEFSYRVRTENQIRRLFITRGLCKYCSEQPVFKIAISQQTYVNGRTSTSRNSSSILTLSSHGKTSLTFARLSCREKKAECNLAQTAVNTWNLNTSKVNTLDTDKTTKLRNGIAQLWITKVLTKLTVKFMSCNFRFKTSNVIKVLHSCMTVNITTNIRQRLMINKQKIQALF